MTTAASTVDMLLDQLLVESNDLTWHALADALEEAGQTNQARLARLNVLLRRGLLGQTSPRQAEQIILLRECYPAVPQVVNSINMTFSHIPRGHYLSSERPLGGKRRVVKKGVTHDFFLGTTTVTNAQLARLFNRQPLTPEGIRHKEAFVDARFIAGVAVDVSWDARAEAYGEYLRVLAEQHPGLPAVMVSVRMAIRFCDWLSDLPAEKRAGRTYRLPTESEWEYACRGPHVTHDDFHFGTFGKGEHVPFTCMNYRRGIWGSATVNAFSKTWNAWGLHQMHGNVEEMCTHETFSGIYSSKGGSFQSYQNDCKAWQRQGISANVASQSVGFRVLMTQGEKK
jgi:formylglycine-generating enzyme required for sulfatase activity